MLQKELKILCAQIRHYNRGSSCPITVDEVMDKHRTRRRIGWACLILILSIISLHREHLSLWRSCFVRLPSSATNAFVPQRNCDFCRNVTTVERIRNISPYQFTQKYAYSGVPVVIEDAMTNWTAPQTFSYEYFASLYRSSRQRISKARKRTCQFFPYKTEFHRLSEVFAMNGSRRAQPWYVGWSNCDLEIANQLRSHYSRPYFLPIDSESIRTDWIFMGTPGNAAHMHIDHVGRPSWQAQIRGRKLWQLEPPLECYTECTDLSVEVDSGNVIVLDTNWWYHRTEIIGNEVSITIGAEYD